MLTLTERKQKLIRILGLPFFQGFRPKSFHESNLKKNFKNVTNCKMANCLKIQFRLATHCKILSKMETDFLNHLNKARNVLFKKNHFFCSKQKLIEIIIHEFIYLIVTETLNLIRPFGFSQLFFALR